MAEKIEEKSTNKNRRGAYQAPESKENVETTKKRTTKKTADALTAGKTNNQTATKKRTTKKVEDTSKENAKTTTKKKTTRKTEDTSKENTKATTQKRTTKKTENAPKEESSNKTTAEGKKEKKPTTRKTKKEEIKDKDEKMLVVEKKEKNTLTKKEQKELETIEKEIKSKQIQSQGKMSTIYGNVFKNILYAIIVILYFVLIIMGCKSIKSDIFITDLKVFSMTLIITTICVFEKAYKKDSGKLAITGIEFLVLSICTLLSIRIYTIFNSKFVSSITSFALLFAIYYVAKAIKVYIQEKKQLNKEVNDIVTRRE